MAPGRFNYVLRTTVQASAEALCPGVFLYIGENRPLISAHTVVREANICRLNVVLRVFFRG